METKNKIINELATIGSNDLVVLNYTDAKIYNYTKDFLLETCLEYIETSTENEKLVETAINEKDFVFFLVTYILQHDSNSCEYMTAQGTVENEIALTCNDDFIEPNNRNCYDNRDYHNLIGGGR
jgi:hypothetical protein